MKEHILDVSRSMLYRVRKEAASQVMGSEKEYRLLWSYCAELIRSNPGSTCIIKAKPYEDNAAVFHRIYICPGSKEGFLEGFRPVIGLEKVLVVFC